MVILLIDAGYLVNVRNVKNEGENKTFFYLKVSKLMLNLIYNTITVQI